MKLSGQCRFKKTKTNLTWKSPEFRWTYKYTCIYTLLKTMCFSMFLYITWISPEISPETHLNLTWILVTFRWVFFVFSGWSSCPDDYHTAIKVHICPIPLHSITWQATQSHIAASSDDWQVHCHGQVSGQATQSHWPVTASDAQAVSQPPQLLSELLGCLADIKAREMVKNTYAKISI